MKSRVLGLFLLALLGFVCAKKEPSDHTDSSLTTAHIDNARTRTRTTREKESSTDSDNDNDNDDNNGNGNGNDNTNNPPAVNNNMTNSTSGTLGPKPTAVTGNPKPEASKNGQGHIFTPVSLLLGSLALVALWE